MANTHGTISPGQQKFIIGQMGIQFPEDLPADLGEYWEKNPKALRDAERRMLLRQDARPVISDIAEGPYPFVVDYGADLGKVIAGAKFNSDATAEHFPARMEGRLNLEGYLFHFNHHISSPYGFQEMSKSGLIVGALHELVPFGKKYPDFQRRFPIVGLGQTWRDSDGDLRVAVLGELDSERRLFLGVWALDWFSFFRFLAFRIVSAE